MQALIENSVVVAYPYSYSQLRRDNPQTSYPASPTVEALQAFGLFDVQDTTPPDFNPSTHRIEQARPSLVEGVWTQVWTVVELTPAEAQQYAKQLQDGIVAQTQQRLDDFARTKNYDGMLSACTYATSTVPRFQAEGQYCVEARDATWAKLYDMLAEVEAGTRPMPNSFADVEPELPALAWPA